MYLKVKISIILVLLILSAATIISQVEKGHPDWAYREKDPSKKICFVLYTLHNNTLKTTAQFYPLNDSESRIVEFQIKQDNQWKTLVSTSINEESYGLENSTDKLWTANFRVEHWESTKNFQYRIVGLEGQVTYEGTIRRDPVDKKEIVVAAFTGNSNKDRRMKPDLIKNLKAQDPDLLFFSGDQSYDHLNHLDAWLLFGRQFGEIIKDRPTICIPDDHDVGLPNLWGNSGKPTPEGYWNPAYTKAVEYAQTSNLPDPYDPTPIERGIGVYYTSLKVGRVDFAIIEDRKFKSPYTVLDKEELEKKGVVMSRADHVKIPPPNPNDIDVPEATLLGSRQLHFLDDWGTKWEEVDMKCVLSQTIFAGGAHLHHGERLAMDLDANGWPQSGRNRAIRAIRKAFAFHIAGDQHLATVIHHGVDEWNDAMYSFCTPSIVNYYPRGWMPLEREGKRIDSPLPYSGEYLDGFGNHITMHAYVNPDSQRANKYGGEWGENADGYAIVRFNVEKRTITMECWPRGVDLAQKDAPQYLGWPLTINQEDNYGRIAKGYLPTLNIIGTNDPVLQVINEKNEETVYTIRIKGNVYSPKVFEEGYYTIKIGEGKNQKTLNHIKSIDLNENKEIEITL